MLLRPGQRVLAHSVHQTALNMTVRSFGQAAAPNDFIKQRDAYRAEMSKLRKDWGEDHKQKMEEKAARDRAERRQLVLQRAIRLRAHREKVSRNLELERKKDEERRQRNREHLAKTHIMWEEDQAKKRRQRQAAMNDLIEESKYWITPENKNQLITPELFAKTPTTTGIVTPTSNYWRYEVFVPSLKRLLSNHFRESMMNMSSKELLQRHEGQGRVAKRALVETFLNDMIESSVDRANFRELVQNTVDDMEHTGTFDTINQEVWNVNASLRDQFDSDSSSMGDDILDRDDCIAFLMECKEAGTLSKKASKLNFHTLSDEQLDALVTEHYLAEVSDASSDTSSDAGSDSGKTAAAPSKSSQQPGKKAKSYDSINRLLSE